MEYTQQRTSRNATGSQEAIYQPYSAGNYVHGGLVMPNGKSQPGQPTNPWGSIDPTKPIQQPMQGTVEQAQQGLNYAAQQGWGKQLSPQQFQQMASSIGYAGGPVTNTMYNSALGWLDQNMGQRLPQQQGGSQYQPQLGAAANRPYEQTPSTFVSKRNDLMNAILMNPQTMGQDVQDRMFEQQKEQQQQMMDQMKGQLGQASVARGQGAGSAQYGAQQAGLARNQIENLMGARRDISQKAAAQNRQDEMNALQMAQGMDQQEWQQGAQNRMNSLQEWLGMVGAGQDQQRIDIGSKQFDQQFGLDFLRYLTQKDQFGQSMSQNNNQFLEQMGLNWANLQNNQQSNFLRYLFGG